ncbi:BON domain-containing protein [Planctomyces sp. SH-PL14]|uniref:BON domain-containing protein n=1 Tax=Planctomyces sp. SH-PL14 TaxID=1632864 RepID=UPI00078D76BF|nr:BON domain-containing protein [Planctomyces sp. SH-PL14]AMV22066.1 hypothetical protein VT03_29455 [Planctomyces sp. SH-PL14]
MNTAARRVSSSKSSQHRSYVAGVAGLGEERLREEQALLAQFFAAEGAADRPAAGGEAPTVLEYDATTTSAAVPQVRAAHVEPLESCSDEDLEARLRDEFERSGVLGFQALTLRVRGGAAHLSGKLDSHYELVIALQMASRVSGIVAVRHSIEVLPVAEQKETWTELALETVRQNRRWLLRWTRLAVVSTVLLGGVGVARALWLSRYVPPVPLVPAHGAIEFDGKPAAGAIVRLHPAAARKDLSSLPQALADDAGRFQLSTFRRNDGAPVGEYIVTVTWRPDVATKDGRVERGPNVIPPKCTKASSSPLRVTVSQQGGDLGTVVVPR